VIVVTRYRVPQGAEFAPRLREAMDVFVSRPGCLRASIGRAVDDPGLWLLETVWESVGAYRRALSDAGVKVRAVPVMYHAIDEPTAYEALVTWSPADGIAEHASALVADPWPPPESG
jgi:quinol monooxygenase YgiN